MSSLDEYKKKVQELSKARDEMTKQLAGEFTSLFKEFFEKNPDIKSFGWTQYTPYFNDGDTCTFSANTYDLYLNEERSDEIGYKEVVTRVGNHDFPENTKYHPQTGKMLWRTSYEETPLRKDVNRVCKEITSILETIPEDLLESLFGEGLITIYPDRYEVSNYDHE